MFIAQPPAEILMLLRSECPTLQERQRSYYTDFEHIAADGAKDFYSLNSWFCKNTSASRS